MKLIRSKAKGLQQRLFADSFALNLLPLAYERGSFNYYYLYTEMKSTAAIRKTANSKGAAIFKKMLDDKKAVQAHLKKGGKISDLKGKFNLVKTVSIKGA